MVEAVASAAPIGNGYRLNHRPTFSAVVHYPSTRAKDVDAAYEYAFDNSMSLAELLRVRRRTAGRTLGAVP